MWPDFSRDFLDLCCFLFVCCHVRKKKWMKTPSLAPPHFASIAHNCIRAIFKKENFQLGVFAPNLKKTSPSAHQTNFAPPPKAASASAAAKSRLRLPSSSSSPPPLCCRLLFLLSSYSSFYWLLPPHFFVKISNVRILKNEWWTLIYKPYSLWIIRCNCSLPLNY